MTGIDRTSSRLVGTARARVGQIAGAFAIDVGGFAALGALTVVAVVTDAADLTVLGGLALAGLAIAQLRSWSRSGRTLGTVVTGVRQVTTFDGAPPGFDRAFGSTWFADVRHARDPACPATIVTAPSPAAPPRVPPAARSGADSGRSTSRALLVIDGRVGGAIGEGVVIGRNPTATGGERAVSVADIGREISKVHLAVRVDETGRVWAVDRQSTNGSTITRRDGAELELAPGEPVEMTAGDVVHIGSHTVAVQFVTEVQVA